VVTRKGLITYKYI